MLPDSSKLVSDKTRTVHTLSRILLATAVMATAKRPLNQPLVALNLKHLVTAMGNTSLFWLRSTKPNLRLRLITAFSLYSRMA